MKSEVSVSKLSGGKPSLNFILAILGIVAIGAVAGVYFFSDNAVSAQDATSGGYTKKLEPSEPTTKDSKKTEAEIAESKDLSDNNVIYLNAGNIDVSSAEGLAMRRELVEFPGKQMRLVKFSGAIEPAWYRSLAKTGVMIVDYIPNNSYLVYGDFAALSKIQAEALKSDSPIVWDAEYTAKQRVDPTVQPRFERSATTGEINYFNIQLVKDKQTNAETLGLIATRQLAPEKVRDEYLHYVNVTAALSLEGLSEIAARADVISIQPYREPRKLDERQNMIITGKIVGNAPLPGDYFTWLTGKGFDQSQFSTSNFAVDVTDSGLDNGTAAPNHFGLYTTGNVTNPSRVVYARLEGTANVGSSIQGCDGHGTLNTHIIGGYVPSGAPYNAFPFADASGFRYGLGVAPFVKVGSSVIFDPNTYTNPDFEDLQSRAYNNGARISSNSWGASTNTYTSDSQRYDALVRDAQPTGAAVPVAGNQQMVILFAAGNDGSGAGTVGSPGTGKNVITVGASEGVQAFGGADGCGTTDTEANSSNDIVGFSSRGPTSDSRKKPDLVAPGTHISGGVAQTAGQLSTTPAVANGSANACFTAGGVCGGSGNNFFPVGQQWYTASSGTSHSTPAAAGGAALIRQHFLNLGQAPASPAMTKAVMMNGARYMSGVGANDNFYSNNQGMGLLDLNATLDGITNALVRRDQVPADKFTATSQTRVFNTTATAGKLMRITLAYTDAPGTTTGSAARNNLNLTVVNGANTYLGNVFTGQLSVTGGTADALNNVESVYMPSTASGAVTITVTAANINSDGVPGDADVLDQDFALIVSEIDSSVFANVVGNGVTQTAESFLPENAVPDPGETVTVSLSLLNNGVGATSNLTATLRATGGVTNPSAVQAYGSLAASGGNAARTFTYVPAGVCGSTITLTFDVQDGARSYGTVTRTFTLGTGDSSVQRFSENFDGVTAPALPSGWTTARTGNNPPPLFATTTATPDTAANTVFTNGSTTVSSNSLISTTYALPAGQSNFTLSFRQTRNFEGTATECYDGGILEVSTDGGTTYRNVTDPLVGGVFSAGAYNGTINGGFSNPISGQAGWCSAQATYVTSTVVLPGTMSGQNVKFRWRAGWDSSSVAGNPNWRIDTVSIRSQPAVCVGTQTTMTLVSSSNPAAVGQPVTFTATITPIPSGGTVDFIIDGVPQLAGGGESLASVPVDGAGQASFTTSTLTAGNHTVAARYNGNIAFGFSTNALGGAGQSIIVPTAAGVLVAGRVVSADGRGLSNATVRMSGANGSVRSVRTNSFGYFRFDDVPSGQNYVFETSAKGRRFQPQVISVNDSVTDLVFVSQ